MMDSQKICRGNILGVGRSSFRVHMRTVGRGGRMHATIVGEGVISSLLARGGGGCCIIGLRLRSMRRG
jgi:hypothetical protein